MGGTCTGACVWGCVSGCQLALIEEGKLSLHFLPFPQEGTHTPLNLKPKAAALRPGVSDRPKCRQLSHTPHQSPLFGGRWLHLA